NLQVLSSYWKPGEIIMGTHNTVLQYAQFKAPAAGTYIIDIYGFGRSLRAGTGYTTVDLPYFVKGVRVKTESVSGFEGGSAMIPNPQGDKPTARINDSVYLEAGETVTLGVSSRGNNADENFGLSFKVYTPEDAGRFTGYVVTGGGLPVEGATVAIGDNTTTTDEHGAYELYVLPGTYTATVSKLAYNTTTESVTAAAGNTYNKNFTLNYNNAYSTFSGVFTDGNGTPVNSVTVHLGSVSTITSADGSFSFTVQNGEYTLTATKTGYEPVVDDVVITGDASKNYTINLIPVVIEDAYFFPQDNEFHVTAPWSVGKFANNNNNDPNLEPFSVYGPCPEGPISGLVGWWDGANRDVYGNMLMSTYPDVIDTTINGIDLASYREPGDVIVGPMNGAYKLYACFVAPAAGDYLCTAEISNRATPGCDVNVHLYYSGVLVESNNLTGFGGRPGNDYLDAFGNPTKIVSEAVHFDAGDTFMIAIDNNGSAANDAVLLKMAVYSTGFRTVTGKVTYNHGNPVKNAAVNFGRGLTAYTYDNGNYSIALLNGEYNVTASKDGFESDTKEVNTATTGVVNFTLTAEEQEVKDVYILNDNSEFLPEEVWTVGYLNTATDESNPAFIPFVHCTDLVDMGLVGWNADGHNNDIKGNILKNYTDQDMNNVTGEDSPSYVYWPADAMVGASNDDERVCAKFTAPADGTYLLVADYMGRSTFPGKGSSSDVFLYVNGNVVKRDIIRGFAGTDAAGTGSFGMRPKVHFGEEVTLDFGDTVYFAFNGGGDAAAFDSLGVDFRVYTAGNYFTVSGTVTDTNGQPLEGASLVFGNSTVTTDANGGYEILLGKGDYDVSVNKDG
ncbi:MAG: carboxypeptidase regulatory-like domain-containing protein, partial [Abditibacteriota bacterium]|nr:carboxypeptidase regulatory-like domain-containing protein [Abditibacteriota bacterium]